MPVARLGIFNKHMDLIGRAHVDNCVFVGLKDQTQEEHCHFFRDGRVKMAGCFIAPLSFVRKYAPQLIEGDMSESECASPPTSR